MRGVCGPALFDGLFVPRPRPPVPPPPPLSHQALLSPPALARETALLTRLLYRNKAQHRGGAHYAKLAEARRAGWVGGVAG